jgi:hypothetical protein
VSRRERVANQEEMVVVVAAAERVDVPLTLRDETATNE